MALGGSTTILPWSDRFGLPVDPHDAGMLPLLMLLGKFKLVVGAINGLSGETAQDRASAPVCVPPDHAEFLSLPSSVADRA